jgi:apolipoprotein N-acyltransferase
MSKLLPRQASKPAGEQEKDALPGLRLTAPRSLPISLFAAAASGVLVWLSFPRADLGPLALVALIPVLWAVAGARPRRAALLGFVAGGIGFGLQMGWLTTQTWLGWTGFSLLQGGWFALGFALIATAWRDERPVRSAFAAAAIWAVVEWARQAWPFGGVSFSDLGATQHDNPVLLPAASVVGSLGIGFLVVAVNGLVLVAVTRAGRRLAAALIAGVLAVGPVLIPLRAPSGPGINVAIVQGNVPEEIGAADRIIEDRIVAENHARLTKRLAGDPPDLVVWPENALDQDPTRDPALATLVFDAVTAAGTHTLIGAITTDGGGRLLNENLLYDPGGRLIGRYAKNHILPFGEYVPFRRFLRWIPDINRVRDDLSPGVNPGRFRLPTGSFASAICFENNFADLVRRYTGPDEGVVVISTNNASFRRSAASKQHLALSELRAVENGRWVVHAALSGISGIIDHRGRVLSESGLFVPAVLRAEVPAATGRTVFNVIGGWLPFVYLAGAAAALVAVRRPRRRDMAPLRPDAPVTVVLPTYNERETIGQAVAGVRAVGEGTGVIVVDDSSPDGTADVVRDMDGVTLLSRPVKGGLASAYADGFRRALDDGAELVVEMDADLSHRAEDLPGLLAAARDHHLVVGSRYVPGGAVRNWGLLRRLLSRGGNAYARIVLGLPVRDATSGYRVFRRDLLVHLLAEGITADGYAFQVELAYRAWRGGFSVGEAPITFEERRAGESKLSRGIIVEALWHILRWGVRDRVLRRSATRGRSARSPAATASGSHAGAG